MLDVGNVSSESFSMTGSSANASLSLAARSNDVVEVGVEIGAEFDVGISVEFDVGIGDEFDVGMGVEFDVGIGDEFVVGMGVEDAGGRNMRLRFGTCTIRTIARGRREVPRPRLVHFPVFTMRTVTTFTMNWKAFHIL